MTITSDQRGLGSIRRTVEQKSDEDGEDIPKRMLDYKHTTDVDFFYLGNPNLANSSDGESERQATIRDSPKKVGMHTNLSYNTKAINENLSMM